MGSARVLSARVPSLIGAAFHLGVQREIQERVHGSLSARLAARSSQHFNSPLGAPDLQFQRQRRESLTKDYWWTALCTLVEYLTHLSPHTKLIPSLDLSRDKAFEFGSNRGRCGSWQEIAQLPKHTMELPASSNSFHLRGPRFERFRPAFLSRRSKAYRAAIWEATLESDDPSSSNAPLLKRRTDQLHTALSPQSQLTRNSTLSSGIEMTHTNEGEHCIAALRRNISRVHLTETPTKLVWHRILY